MDPRNFLYEDYIFQFEELGYNAELHTISGVNSILANCKYLHGNSINYIDTNGKQATINKSYAQIIMEAGKTYNVSPYHLASRILQEQGTTGTAMVSGNYNSTYRGYYNFFNIGATGSDIMANGLKYAKIMDGLHRKKQYMEEQNLLQKNTYNMDNLHYIYKNLML